MARIAVVGAGLCGLAAAILLAEDGHEVTVLERDQQCVPSNAPDAWQAWSRRGVAQFRQPHGLHAGARRTLEAHIPGVLEVLAAAGGLRFSQLDPLPPPIAEDPPRPGDDRYLTLTGRRPVLEYAFAGVAEKVVSVQRGVTVAGC